MKSRRLWNFGLDQEDESNQKRLRDLENGQCLMQDLYGRVGVVQVHPVFEELFHAFDTRPPVQERMEGDEKFFGLWESFLLAYSL